MSNSINIIAQIIGVTGIIVFLFCFHSNEMKKVLKIKLFVDIIWGTHYFLLNAYTGFATNAVCCVREIIFMNNKKGKFKSKRYLIIFVALNCLFAILTWKNVFSVIPAIVSSLATYSFWQKDVNRARYIALINNVCMFIYDIVVLSYAGMIGESLSFISVIIALVRNSTNRL